MRSIRSYSLQFLFVACVLIIAIVLSYRFWVEYPRQLAAIEEHQKREIESLFQGLNQNLAQLHSVVRDWAHWDDSYHFIQQPKEHQHYLDGNVLPNTFELFRLVGMGYYDIDLRPVLLRGYDLEQGDWMPFEQALAWRPTDLFSRDPTSEPAQYNTGWLMTEQGPAAFAIDYVTTSQQDQPPGGYLLFIRLITNTQLEALQAITRLGLELKAIGPNYPGVDDIPRLGSDALVEGIQPVRQRILINPAGTPVALLTITHDPLTIPTMMGMGEIILLLGLVLIPILILVQTDRVLLKPLTRGAERIDKMVHDGSLQMLPQEFRIRELEQIRTAFNRSVELVHAQQERLTELSRTDGLTGIPNRRAFDSSADTAWRQAKRSHQSFLLAMIDLDYFKLFNDQQGHARGDEALRAVAQTMAGFARRSGDFCARLGGEEFAAVVPGLTEDEARHWVEELRLAVEKLAIEHPGSPIASILTASIGVLFVPKPGNAGTELIELMPVADQALYLAKHQGRNRVSFKVLTSQELFREEA